MQIEHISVILYQRCFHKYFSAMQKDWTGSYSVIWLQENNRHALNLHWTERGTFCPISILCHREENWWRLSRNISNVLSLRQGCQNSPPASIIISDSTGRNTLQIKLSLWWLQLLPHKLGNVQTSHCYSCIFNHTSYFHYTHPTWIMGGGWLGFCVFTPFCVFVGRSTSI